MTDRSLDSLSSPFYPRAVEWIARVTARGVACMIIQTGRTQAEHQVNLLNRTSSTPLSLHLPRKMRWPVDQFLLVADREKCDAMDLAPFAQYQLHGANNLHWATTDPAWGVIGEECERAGLRWGGRWRTPYDPGHGELILPWKAQYLAEERSRPWPLFNLKEHTHG